MSSKGRKERRLLRKQRNIEKEISYKRDAWEMGKLIEENHNQEDYSKEYTVELTSRLMNIIKSDLVNSIDNNNFVIKYRSVKNKIIDLMIHWSPEVNYFRDWVILKLSLEYYWDDRDNLKEKLTNLISYENYG